MPKILFLCLGNICRSPMAEGAFTHHVNREGLSSHFVIDSCGTGGHHAGDPPDSRMISTAAKRGIDISHLRARQLKPDDFLTFDMILAMDSSNHDDALRVLKRLKPQSGAKVADLVLMRRFESGHVEGKAIKDVPDPWYGDMKGFEEVCELLIDCSANLLAAIREEHRL